MNSKRVDIRMNSKTAIALSTIGITVILMVVIAPTLANQQTFGVKVKKVDPPRKGHVKFVKRCFVRFGKRMCRWVPVPIRAGGGLTGGARPY